MLKQKNEKVSTCRIWVHGRLLLLSQVSRQRIHISPESLHFFLQQLSMGPPGPGGAGGRLLVDSLLGQGLGEGQGALLHY